MAWLWPWRFLFFNFFVVYLTPPYEIRTLSSGTSMLIWAITSSNPGLCPALPGIENSKKDRGFLLYFMFLGGSGPGDPFGHRSSRIISFRYSQCVSHFALRNAYHTSLRPSSLFESRHPSLRVVFSLSQCLLHFTELFIAVRCHLASIGFQLSSHT